MGVQLARRELMVNTTEEEYYRVVAGQLREVHGIDWNEAIAVCGMGMMFKHYMGDVLPSTLSWKINSLVKADRQRRRDETNDPI